MNVIAALAARRTVRAFLPDPIPPETLRAILEAALRAPSWANTQPWELYAAVGEPLERIRSAYAEKLAACAPRALDLPAPQSWPEAQEGRMSSLRAERAATLERACPDPADREEMARLNYRFFNAPAVVYLCMDRSLSAWSLFDLGLCAQSLMLAAQDLGIASAPAVMLAAHPDAIRAELGIPGSLSVVIGIALGREDAGHPQNAYRSPRRAFAEAVKIKGR